MQIRRTARALGFFALAAIAAAGAGCDTLSQLSNASSNQDINQPDLLSVHQLPGDYATNVSVPTKDPHSFTIVAVLPLTGTRAVAGQAMQRGLQLATDEVNAAGGVNGQPVQLVVLDTRSNPDRGESVLDTLSNYGEALLLVGDGPLAVTDADQLSKYPTVVGFLCDYVAGPQQTPNNGVRIYLNGDEEGNLIENYISASVVDRAAIVYQNDQLGVSNKQYLLYLLTADKGIFTTSETYSPGEENFSLLGQAMMRVNSGALVLIGNGPEYPKILKSFEDAGWQGIVLGYAGLGGLGTVAGSGRLAQAAAYPLPDFATNPRGTDAGRAFVDAYHAKYNTDPDLPAAYAYDNIRALAAAAKAALSNDPSKIRNAFIAMNAYTGAAGRYDIKADGDTEMPLRLLRSDGQPLPPPSKPEELPASRKLQGLTVPGLTQP